MRAIRATADSAPLGSDNAELARRWQELRASGAELTEAFCTGGLGATAAEATELINGRTEAVRAYKSSLSRLQGNPVRSQPPLAPLKPLSEIVDRIEPELPLVGRQQIEELTEAVCEDLAPGGYYLGSTTSEFIEAFRGAIDRSDPDGSAAGWSVEVVYDVIEFGDCGT